MPHLPSTPLPAGRMPWGANPLRERDETLAVIDIWDDLTVQRRRSPRYGRWVVAAAAVGLCLWAASSSFPVALRYIAGS